MRPHLFCCSAGFCLRSDDQKDGLQNLGSELMRFRAAIKLTLLHCKTTLDNNFADLEFKVTRFGYILWCRCHY